MGEIIQVTVAVNSEEGARQIADTLVANRLAASVWISGPISSTYWWKGKTERATEWVCTIKTQEALYSSVEHTIKKLHPYEEPGILAHPVLTGSQSYLRWIKQETRADVSGAQDQDEQLAEETSKERLLQDLIAAHERLLIAATEAQQRGISHQRDGWGPREILAHVAGWEAMAVSRIPRIIAGMPPITYDSEEQHAAMDDAINAMVVTMIGEQSFEAVCTIFHKTYLADAEIIRGLDEAHVRPGSYVYERIKAAIAHCYEHIQALEQLGLLNNEEETHDGTK
jgi:periplasmic divalent cation tolerance protein